MPNYKDIEEAQKIRKMVLDACEIDYAYEGEDPFIRITETYIDPLLTEEIARIRYEAVMCERQRIRREI